MAASGKQATSGVHKNRQKIDRLQTERDSAVRQAALLEERQRQAEKRFDRIENVLEKLANGQPQASQGNPDTDGLKSIFMNREQYDDDPTVALAAVAKYLEDKFDSKLGQETSKLKESVLMESQQLLASQRQEAQRDQRIENLVGSEYRDQSSPIYQAADRIAAQIRQENGGELSSKDMLLAFSLAKNEVGGAEVDQESDDSEDFAPDSTEGIGNATPADNQTLAQSGPPLTNADRKASVASKVQKMMGKG